MQGYRALEPCFLTPSNRCGGAKEIRKRAAFVLPITPTNVESMIFPSLVICILAREISSEQKEFIQCG